MPTISYPNPILAGMHPDPTICYVGGYYYLATSSFGQFPGAPLYRSRDLSEWEFVRHILSRPEQLDFVLDQRLARSGIFAPTLRHHDGRFYLITTLIGKGGHFIVTAEDPAQEWSDPIWLDQDHQGGIDPSLTFLDDGTVLCQSTGGRGEPHGIVQFEIDPNTGKGLSPRTFLTSGFGWKATEGPHLFQRGNFWYLLTAEGGTETNHRVAIGRSDSPWGPWEPCPHNPILTHAGIESAIQNTGHGDLIEGADGQWWMVFLGVRPQGYPPVHLLGRETYLAPVEWSADGWPVVNEGKPVKVRGNELSDGLKWADNFDTADGMLHHRWVTIGRAYRDVYDLSTGDGMRLIAQSTTLSTHSTKAWVGARLTQPAAIYECEIALEDSEAEVGISIFMEASGYYSLGMIQSAAGDSIRARFTRCVMDLHTVQEREVDIEHRFRLRMELTKEPEGWHGEPSCFIFSVQTANGEWLEIGRGESRLLSTELIGGFGGLFTGVYCVGRAGATGRVLSFSQTR